MVPGPPGAGGVSAAGAVRAALVRGPGTVVRQPHSLEVMSALDPHERTTPATYSIALVSQPGGHYWNNSTVTLSFTQQKRNVVILMIF